MKKYLPVIFFVFTQFATAQTTVHKLWGTATQGGALGFGTIIQADSAGMNFHLVHTFDSIHGSYPEGNMTMCGGIIYCISHLGGQGNSCVMYTLDPATNIFTAIYDFDSHAFDGDIPLWGLLHASNGKLYGMTSAGGTYYKGAIYYLDCSDNSYHKIHDFDGPNGSSPQGGLLEASDGKLYGMTHDGGVNDMGVIFSYDISSDIYTVLHHCDSATGRHPYYGQLIEPVNGLLYGMTNDGGAQDAGVIFSYSITSNQYTVLHDFDVLSATNGGYPYGGLMKANDGNLYGMTESGGAMYMGIIFRLDSGTNNFSKLYDFDYTNGAYPWCSLTQAHDNMLYGTTYQGGAYGNGTVFRFDLSALFTNPYTDIFDFDGTNGSHPLCDIFESTEVTAGIASINNAGGDFVLYNHSNGRFTFIVNSRKYSTLAIYDAVGKNIFSRNLAYGKNEIDLSSSPGGIYFFSASNGEQSFNQKIFLK